MSLLYLVILIFVTIFICGAAAFPFWKVRDRIKTHHPQLWQEKGPFDLRTMTAYPSVVSGFLEIIALADRDEVLLKKDPELIKWTRLSRELWKMLPRGFFGQILMALGFLYTVILFTNLIHGALT